MADQKVPKLYTEAEAADLLEMTPRMLANRRRAKKISAIKDGHHVLYTLEHLAEYQQAHLLKSRAPSEEIDPVVLLKLLRRTLLKK